MSSGSPARRIWSLCSGRTAAVVSSIGPGTRVHRYRSRVESFSARIARPVTRMPLQSIADQQLVSSLDYDLVCR